MSVCPGGEKWTVSLDDDSTVLQLKEALESQCHIAPAQQRLIYKGYVLKVQAHHTAPCTDLTRYGIDANPAPPKNKKRGHSRSPAVVAAAGAVSRRLQAKAFSTSATSGAQWTPSNWPAS